MNKENKERFERSLNIKKNSAKIIFSILIRGWFFKFSGAHAHAHPRARARAPPYPPFPRARVCARTHARAHAHARAREDTREDTRICRRALINFFKLQEKKVFFNSEGIKKWKVKIIKECLVRSKVRTLGIVRLAEKEMPFTDYIVAVVVRKNPNPLTNFFKNIK